ncbi:MAG: hypothetical protein HZB18_05365 [Chloroflexi bacterium]|nr:hypothetical protein [Chloroflexota bacterium]
MYLRNSLSLAGKEKPADSPNCTHDFHTIIATMIILRKSFQAFMAHLIDYAGLYPPANLQLEEAFRNFVKYQSDPEAWMLSRFIVPAKRLAELPNFEESLSFSVLGRGGKDDDDFLENLKLDLADIQTFRLLHENAAVDMLETALPVSAFAGQSSHGLVNKTAEIFNINGLTVFFETAAGDDWQERAENLIRALRKIKDKHVGFKLRTGGVTANAFPSTEQVAWTIATARDAGIPIKCTAGLHHPMRHYHESVQTKMHGFLNVFGAGVLAVTNNLSIEQIKAILEDEDPASFIFDEAGFAWKNLRIVTSGITHARHQIVSFGSCSFDDPREDLQKLGLLA